VKKNPRQNINFGFMDNLRIATAQFEHRSGDIAYNLSVIERLSKQAASAGASVIAFHECAATGYSFARKLSKAQMLALANVIPEGEITQALIAIAKNNKITVLAGLFEKDVSDNLYKAYVCVDGDGLKARFRKLHPFINPHILPGNEYCVFELNGWNCGILICYDNNITENVRATTLLGADIIFMPHVTMCTPSPRPGAGFVDPKLWLNRMSDPKTLAKEFNGLKGREWLMKWLPGKAFENGVYVVFSNAIGMDDDQLKNGCSMIIDPFGDIIAECHTLGDDFVTALLSPEKLFLAGGYRYKNARRPDLYRTIIGQEHHPVQKVSWMDEHK
jgi:predicted amidohydrolase